MIAPPRELHARGRVLQLGGGHPTVVGTHEGQITAVAWSPDGEAFVSGSSDGLVRLWGVGGNEPTRTMKGHRGTVGDSRHHPMAKD